MADLVDCYTTVPELRDRLRDQLSTHDHEYEQAILAASRAVDAWCGRIFYQTYPTSRLLRAEHPDVLYVSDIATVNQLIVETDDSDDGTSFTPWATTDYEAGPPERMNGAPYTVIRAVGDRFFPAPCAPRSSWSTRGWGRRHSGVRITARWGWAETPPAVSAATTMIAVSIFKSKDVGSRTSVPSTGGFPTAPAVVPTLGSEAEALLLQYRVVTLA